MLVAVKPKFQVTIPAKLREQVDLHEGDLMEASAVGDGILFRLKEVVDRHAAIPAGESLSDSEAEPIEDALARIAKQIPESDWDHIPPDLSARHDDYL
ncbi:MAG: AbrB/MazE/SpoVT family DNA-binding domain-containing protein [Gammaproteobacteria bacterium]|nr:AbrB/MazE/SpoVT family DNA-binding domain-containing protein [Gammaproteobacteria bacterium]